MAIPLSFFQILYYSTSLFEGVGMSPEDGQAATCGVGVLSVIMTAVIVSRKKFAKFNCIAADSNSVFEFSCFKISNAKENMHQ